MSTCMMNGLIDHKQHSYIYLCLDKSDYRPRTCNTRNHLFIISSKLISKQQQKYLTIYKWHTSKVTSLLPSDDVNFFTSGSTWVFCISFKMRLSLHCESSWSNDESTLHYRFGSDIFVSNQKLIFKCCMYMYMQVFRWKCFSVFVI